MHRILTIVLLAASAAAPGQIRKVAPEMDAIVAAGAQIEKLSGVVFYRASPGREAYDVVVAEAPATAR